MPALRPEQQRQIMLNGKNVLNSIGIQPKSFTPPGGLQDFATLKTMSEVGFQTNIDWWVKLPESSGIIVIEVMRFCDLQRGAELGLNCVLKEVNQILEEARRVGSERGYVCLAFHVQDFMDSQGEIDTDKMIRYFDVVRAIQNSGDYLFMTPEEFGSWKKNRTI